jgi:hypothetical protein
MLGVPQDASVRNEVDGGTNLQSTAGAVPNALNGAVVSVPPVILPLLPGLVVVALLHVVVKVSVVLPALTAAATLIKLPV